MFIETAIRIKGFNQAARKYPDESDLFYETSDIYFIDTAKITFFKATRVEAVFEVVGVTRLATAATRRRNWHGIVL